MVLRCCDLPTIGVAARTCRRMRAVAADYLKRADRRAHLAMAGLPLLGIDAPDAHLFIRRNGKTYVLGRPRLLSDGLTVRFWDYKYYYDNGLPLYACDLRFERWPSPSGGGDDWRLAVVRWVGLQAPLTRRYLCATRLGVLETWHSRGDARGNDSMLIMTASHDRTRHTSMPSSELESWDHEIAKVFAHNCRSCQVHVAYSYYKQHPPPAHT